MLKKQSWAGLGFCLAGLTAVLCAALWVASQTHAGFLAHSAFDSYTLQAMAWRDGRIALDYDRPWLELAIYQGQYYVSFPPVPAIPMWVLSFFFGENTPSGLVTLLYLLGAYVAAYYLCKRHMSPGHAALCAVFAVLGGSVLDIAVSGEGFSGGVWYQAQMLAFFLTMLSFLLMDGSSKKGWAAGLICIALAVGCRPFNVLYVPVLLWMLCQKTRRETFWQTIAGMLPYIAIPAAIACAYGGYNYVRFGNPLEFGHSYLPEFTRSGEPMFSASRILSNLRNIFRAPWLENGALRFPAVSAFAVYLTNPLIFLGLEHFAEKALRKRADSIDVMLMVLLLAHTLLLLTHRTNGGWQYGTRYLTDTVPAFLYLFIRNKKTVRLWEGVIMGMLIAFNVYGTVVFHYI